jgi:hypothetical protein
MNRRAVSAFFGVLLLLLQVLQGATADAMRCAADDIAADVAAGALAGPQHCGPDHAATLQRPATPSCPFCAAGACRMVHAPALPPVLEVFDRPVPPAFAPTWRSDERLDGLATRILRPPR